ALIALIASNVTSYLRRPTPPHDARPPLGAGPLGGGMVVGGGLREEDLAGGPVLVYFWGSWCGACALQSPVVEGLWQEGVKVVSVAVGSGGDEEVRAFMGERGYSFPTLNDVGGGAQRAWGVSAFPTLFVYGADGRLRFSEVGYTSSLGLRARLAWAGR
ncbi:MAG: redoxin domain-containing protein, partial [Deltaproteobacteria bacterium]|nr:redoxin domain-containing protein [Deltaproteobacteria bacterium]